MFNNERFQQEAYTLRELAKLIHENDMAGMDTAPLLAAFKEILNRIRSMVDA